MSRIYTRTGDDGTTSLVGGQSTSKDSPFIEAVGVLDELNALLGVARSLSLPDGIDEIIHIIQDRLFLIGTALATPEKAAVRHPGIRDTDIREMEERIDEFDAKLPPLQQFILPGGSQVGAQLHLARTVARRAERRCVALSRTTGAHSQALCYLNRLSDLLFVLARYVNLLDAAPESAHQP